MSSFVYEKRSVRKNAKKNIIVKSIINEYKIKMNSFYPKDKSPNVFINKLEYRMKHYYHLYKSKNEYTK